MSKMGPNTINTFYQLSLGPRQWKCSITNKVIRQRNVCYSWYVNGSIGVLCSKTSQIGSKICKWCQTAKGLYVDPDPSQGSIVANNPMDLLCIDFMKVDPSKDGKEKCFSHDRCILKI